MKKGAKNVSVSVRDRLLRLARERGEVFELVLVRYANERLLYRLSKSGHASRFVLKGATLFMVWTGVPHRASRDVDLLGFGESSEEHIRAVFGELFALDVGDDGVRFDVDSMDVGPIRQEEEYSGVRVLVTAYIATARLHLQFDIGFGDAITPGTVEVEVPVLLDHEPPRLRAYPRETVVAEKLEAMVQLGLANTRLKDFFDLAVFAREFEFDGEVLVAAIRATFERRGTTLPTSLPVALTPTFTEDSAKQTQWVAFGRKSGVASIGELPAVAGEIAAFVGAPLDAAANGALFLKSWKPGGPWK